LHQALETHCAKMFCANISYLTVCPGYLHFSMCDLLELAGEGAESVVVDEVCGCLLALA